MKLLLVAILSLVSTSLYGEKLNPNVKTEEINDFSGGLNNRLPAQLLPKNQSPNLSNVIIDEGQLKVRNGYEIVAVTGTMSKVNSMFEFIDDDGEKNLLISDSERVLSTKDFITYTLVRATQDANYIFRFAQGRGKVLATNGFNFPFAWDGQTKTDLDGLGGRPNVPPAKYAAFYHDRFWVCNTTVSNSECRFSDFVTSAGARIDPLTDVRAWPADNQLNIGRGDGFPISGMTIENGQLKIHKYNSSIYTIFGDDETSYFPVKSVSEKGTTSQESIVHLDNFTYFKAEDGIYATDGKNVIRISEDMELDMEDVKRSQSNIVANVWDTFAQFDSKKESVGGTTATAAGELIVLSSQVISRTGAVEEDCYLHVASTWSEYLPVNSVYIDSANIYTAWIQDVQGRVGFSGAGCGEQKSPTLIFRNETASTTYAVKMPVGVNTVFHLSSTFTFSTQDLVNGKVDMKIEIDTAGFSVTPENCSVNFTSMSKWGFVLATTTGSYTSEITTVTAADLTNWDTFLANVQTNGGNVIFSIKASTSLLGMSTETFTSISAGSGISFSANKNYFQWGATITNTNYEPNMDVSAKVNSVRVNHNEGGFPDTREIAVNWKNRLLISVTTTSNTNQIVYVKSKYVIPPNRIPFSRWDGINILSMVKFNDDLYGGSSTAGVVIKLDAGTNDGGTTVNWYYDTPKFNFGIPFFKKQEVEWWLDVDALNNATVRASGSVDDGEYSNFDTSLSGTGRILRIIKFPKSYGKYFKYRLSGGDLDKLPRIDSFNILYTPTEVQ